MTLNPDLKILQKGKTETIIKPASKGIERKQLL